MFGVAPDARLLSRRFLLIAAFRIVADGPVVAMLYFVHVQREGEGGATDSAFNALLFVAFAVAHSVLARPVVKRKLGTILGIDFVRPLFVVVSGITLSCVILLWRPLDGALWNAEGPLYWIATLLFAGAIGGLLWSASFIDYLEFLGVRPLLRTPETRSRETPVFVVRGPYAYCRHPMYGFLVLTLWVGPSMPFGRLEFAALATLYLLIGTLFEERNLRRELGEVYDLYRVNVPMWIPRRSPWRPGVSRAVQDSSWKKG